MGFFFILNSLFRGFMLDEKLYRTTSKFGIFSEKETLNTVFFPFLKGKKCIKVSYSKDMASFEGCFTEYFCQA